MMCEKNEARIKELRKYQLLCDTFNGEGNKLYSHNKGCINGLEDGAKNEREAFLEWLNKHSIFGKTSIRQIDVENKIKELEEKT